ncbi:MAG: hypothetical protein L0G46_03940, partial [Kocuria sp.]|nr:hypothetical protein [Kocuria sp.]
MYDPQRFKEYFEGAFTYEAGFRRNIRRYGNDSAIIDPETGRNWTYAELDADVARVDFGSETFTGTGSLEIAEASEDAAGERVAEHVERVEQLLDACREVSYTQSEQDFALEFDGVDGVVEPQDSAEPETTTAYR